MRKIIFLLFVFSLLVISGCGSPTGEVVSDLGEEPNDLPTDTEPKEIIKYVCPDGETAVEDISNCPEPEEVDEATMGEKNALKKASSYLRVMPFSYSGLIKQLEYEGYTYEEAVYGADNCGADWNEQATLKAQSYLNAMPFSRDRLIEQLIYEGFTESQAEYGVQGVGY